MTHGKKRKKKKNPNAVVGPVSQPPQNAGRAIRDGATYLVSSILSSYGRMDQFLTGRGLQSCKTSRLGRVYCGAFYCLLRTLTLHPSFSPSALVIPSGPLSGHSLPSDPTSSAFYLRLFLLAFLDTVLLCGAGRMDPPVGPCLDDWMARSLDTWTDVIDILGLIDWATSAIHCLRNQLGSACKREEPVSWYDNQRSTTASHSGTSGSVYSFDLVGVCSVAPYGLLPAAACAVHCAASDDRSSSRLRRNVESRSGRGHSSLDMDIKENQSQWHACCILTRSSAHVENSQNFQKSQDFTNFSDCHPFHCLKTLIRAHSLHPLRLPLLAS